MKTINNLFLICICIFCNCSSFDQAQTDMEIIRERVINDLMQHKVDTSRIKTLMSSINDDGTWPGINYIDVSNEGFQHSQHLGNMQILSHAYRKEGSAFQGNPELKKVIDTALDYWLENDFICENWYWNQIGTPERMGHIFLILDEELSENQKQDAQPIFDRSTLNAWGAHHGSGRIKIAGIYGENALFNRNEEVLIEVIEAIVAEIKIADGRGLQADMSFHHRVDRVNNTLSYGSGYANTFAEWAVLVEGTKYAFPETALELLIDFYLDGICQMMVYGKYPDPGAKNRAISRIGELKAWSSAIPEKLSKTSSYREAELQKIVKIRSSDIQPDLIGDRFFWHSEYFSHQRPGYFTSVRMFSTRNKSMEKPYNSEGIKNHHLGDGANFISIIGNEYFNIFPVYDWQRIPGTTVVQKKNLPNAEKIQQSGSMDFVGGVTDGKYGVAAFDFKSPLDPLTARKSWFMFDNEIVCLGSGISSNAEFPVNTTLNQCYLRSDVVISDGSGVEILKRGLYDLKDIRWIHHDNIAYIFPTISNIGLKNDVVSGSWYDIHQWSTTPRDIIQKDVFKLWLDHGIKPQNGKYDYLIVPGINVNEIEDYIRKSGVDILINSTKIQAVYHSELELLQIVFYEPGDITCMDNISISMENAGLLMVHFKNEKIKKLTLSDPSRKLKAMVLGINREIEFDGDIAKIDWNENESKSIITLELPANEYAGKSVIIQ